MPVVAGPPVEYDGRAFLDASLTEPIPVPTAEADGCTHAVVLLTRTGGMRPRPSAFDRYFVGPRLRRLSPELADALPQSRRSLHRLVRAIDAGTSPLGRMQVLGIRVPDLRISKLERDGGVLRDGAARGHDAVMQVFVVPTLQLK